jgi:uncharacterized Zn finger protein
MVPVVCQHCGSDQIRRLDATPRSWLHYYRCDACGEVWTVRLDDPQRTHHSVILRPDPRKSDVE